MRHSNAGHTLIELVVSMAAGSTLMALAMGLVQQSMTWSSIGKSRAAHDRECQRMVDQFRSDVHLSDQVVNGDSGFHLTGGDRHSVDYTTDANRVTRSERDDGETVRLETYLLANSYSAAFDYSDGRNEASLAIRFIPDSSGYASRVDRQAIAKLGRLSQANAMNAVAPETSNPKGTP